MSFGNSQATGIKEKILVITKYVGTLKIKTYLDPLFGIIFLHFLTICFLWRIDVTKYVR